MFPRAAEHDVKNGSCGTPDNGIRFLRSDCQILQSAGQDLKRDQKRTWTEAERCAEHCQFLQRHCLILQKDPRLAWNLRILDVSCRTCLPPRAGAEETSS